MTLRPFTAILMALVTVACGDGSAPAPTGPPSVFPSNRLEGIPESARPILAKALDWVGGANAFDGIGTVTASIKVNQDALTIRHDLTICSDGSVVMSRIREPGDVDEFLGANGGVGWLIRGDDPDPFLIDPDQVRRLARIVQWLNPLSTMMSSSWLHAEILEPTQTNDGPCDVIRLHGLNGTILEFVSQRSNGRPIRSTLSIPRSSGNSYIECRWLAWESKDGRRWPTIIDTRSNAGAVGFVVVQVDFDEEISSATALTPEIINLVNNGAGLSNMVPTAADLAPVTVLSPAVDDPADKP